MNCKRVPCKLLKEGVGCEWKREGAEGRGKEQPEEGDESARPQRARLSGDAAAPWFLEAYRCSRPPERSSPGRGRGSEKRTSSAQPQPSARVGPGCSALARSGAATTAAGLVRRRGPQGPPRAQRAGFHAPIPEGWGPLRGDGSPAPGGLAGYLKRGESFRHSSKSTVIFILPPPRLEGGAGRAERAAGAAALGTQTATASARPRLALRGAAEGALPAGHSSREDGGSSGGSSGPSPAPLPPAPSGAPVTGKPPGSDSLRQPATNPAAGGWGFRQHRPRALRQRT